MIDHSSGWKIALHPAQDGGSYVVAPNRQVPAIRQLLEENGVPHAVDECEIRQDGLAMETLIRVRPGEDMRRVQELLDRAGEQADSGYHWGCEWL